MTVSNALPLVTLRWGEALTAVRRRSGRGLRDAAAAIDGIWPASSMSLQRLEKLDEPPQDSRARRLAALALLAYGWTNLDAFGLSAEDLPKGSGFSEVISLLGNDPRISSFLPIPA